MKHRQKELKPTDIEIANEYVKSGNGVQSVLKIIPNKTYNSADSYFRRLHEDARFQKLIENSKAAAADKLRITIESILRDFITIKDRCMEAEEVKDRSGNSKGVFKFDASNAIKANENLSRFLGLYEKDNEQKTDKKIKVRINLND